MYRVIDLHCDTIPNMYSDFRGREGGFPSFQFRKNRFEPDERRGIYLPVLFPFYPSGSIEEKRQSHHLHMYWGL